MKLCAQRSLHGDVDAIIYSGLRIQRIPSGVVAKVRVNPAVFPTGSVSGFVEGKDGKDGAGTPTSSGAAVVRPLNPGYCRLPNVSIVRAQEYITRKSNPKRRLVIHFDRQSYPGHENGFQGIPHPGVLRSVKFHAPLNVGAAPRMDRTFAGTSAGSPALPHWAPSDPSRAIDGFAGLGEAFQFITEPEVQGKSWVQFEIVLDVPA